MDIELDPSRGVDRPALTKALVRSIAHAAIEDGPGLLGNVLDAAQALAKGEQTLERRAWSLWRESLSVALAEFFRWGRLTRRPNEEEVSRFVEKALEDARAVLGASVEGASPDLNLQALVEPSRFSLYTQLRDSFPKRIEQVDPDLNESPQRIAAHFDHCFELGLRRAWIAKLEEYEPLEAAISGAVGDGVRMRKAWAEHHERIRRYLEEKPVFGQAEDSPVTLAKLYTPSRCYWHVITKKTAKDRDADMETGAVKRVDIHISELQGLIDQWLGQDQKDDAMRIVAGGPGSGKSTFANMLALRQSRFGAYDVLLIPLQGMGGEGVLRERIGEILKYEWLGSFPDNPVKIDRPRRKPLLLIFDGLDEIAKPGEVADDLTKNFILNVRQLVRDENRERIAVKAVVLGRSTASQEACRHAELTSMCLLHVAPMPSMVDDKGDLLDKFKIQNAFVARAETTLHDAADLRTQDRREVYWRNWCRANEIEEPTPRALKDESLSDLSAEPLLCYLLILSGYTGGDWEKAADNRNRVYRRIFHKVYAKEWSGSDAKHSLLHDVSEAEFLKLLACLGLAAWLGGGRTGTDKDFEQVRLDYDDDLDRDFRDLPLGKLKNVAVQFYLREDMGAQPGYEFLHKSFGEYLAARGLIDKAIRELREYKRRPRNEEFVGQWLALTGKQRITNEIFDFMSAEARLRDLVARGTEDEDDEDDIWGDASEWCEQLSKIVGWTLENGIPAHMDADRRTTWREVEERQRNAELALWAVLSAFGRAAHGLAEDKPFDAERAGPIKIAWPAENAAANLSLRIMGAKREHNSTDPFSRCLAGVDLAKQRLVRFDGEGFSLIGARLSHARLDGARLSHARLDGARLEGAMLIGARLSHARLEGARLEGARLEGARLDDAMLIGARLSGAMLDHAVLDHAILNSAILSGAMLIQARLYGARLEGARLDDARLSGARLDDARLSGARLEGARLDGARLDDAILNSARLDGAMLSDTNCKRVRIDSGRLQFADLSQSIELSQKAVNAAKGNSATKLPEGIERPKNWPKTKYKTWQEALAAGDPDG